MTTLENLWYGNIAPNEQYLKGNSNYKKLPPVMTECRNNLSKDLMQEQNEWLEKYDDIINEMHSVAEVEAFKFGFRLAVCLLKESTA